MASCQLVPIYMADLVCNSFLNTCNFFKSDEFHWQNHRNCKWIELIHLGSCSIPHFKAPHLSFFLLKIFSRSIYFKKNELALDHTYRPKIIVYQIHQGTILEEVFRQHFLNIIICTSIYSSLSLFRSRVEITVTPFLFHKKNCRCFWDSNMGL